MVFGSNWNSCSCSFRASSSFEVFDAEQTLRSCHHPPHPPTTPSPAFYSFVFICPTYIRSHQPFTVCFTVLVTRRSSFILLASPHFISPRHLFFLIRIPPLLQGVILSIKLIHPPLKKSRSLTASAFSDLSVSSLSHFVSASPLPAINLPAVLSHSLPPFPPFLPFLCLRIRRRKSRSSCGSLISGRGPSAKLMQRSYT